MKCLPSAALAGILWLATAAGAEEPIRTTVAIKTPLKLLGPDGRFVVLANETRAEANSTFMDVVFRDVHDNAIKAVSVVYRAGQAAVISLDRTEVPGSEQWVAVWADVRVSRSGDFSPSAAGLSFGVVRPGGDGGCFGGCHTCPLESDDVSCSLPDGGRGPEFSCPDGSAFVETVTVTH